MRANRTELLDTVMHRFREGLSELPREARRLGGRFRSGDGYAEYYRELREPTRVLDTDAYRGPVFRWRNSVADHYAHAEAYCWLASELSSGGGSILHASVDGPRGPRYLVGAIEAFWPDRRS